MKYQNRMAIKMMEKHDLVGGEDKAELIADMDATTEKAKNSTNKFVKIWNAFSSHAIGVMLFLFCFTWLDKKLTRMSRDEKEETMEDTFHMKMQEAVYKKMAKKMDVDMDFDTNE